MDSFGSNDQKANSASRPLLQRTDLVGHRIVNILGDRSLTDDAVNFCDFIYQTDNNHCFRMPFGVDISEILMQRIQPGEKHSPLAWPRRKWWHYRRKLWSAKIADILVPANPEDRFPDTGVIVLTSGWFVVQLAGAPMGIMPSVGIIPSLDDNDPMISVWTT